MKSMMTMRSTLRQNSLQIMALMLSLLFQTPHRCHVQAHPSILVNSGRPKCMSVDVPGRTVIKIHYEAPDIDTKGKSDVQYGPTYITLMEKPVETVLDKNGDSERIAERRIRDTEKRRPKPVSQEITQPGGSFLHRVRDDAQVDVCVRASMAGAERPMRFHIRVEDLGDEVPHDETMEKDSLGADHHWSFLETQMDRMEHEMHAIISEADYFKERDAIYHQQTDDMHKATTFWPILHIFILLVTGFTQANHIVQFFKSRRII